MLRLFLLSRMLRKTENIHYITTYYSPEQQIPIELCNMLYCRDHLLNILRRCLFSYFIAD